MIKLRLPLRDIYVVQPFGVDFWYNDPKTGHSYWFYKNMGLSGHPGIDFRARRRCPIYVSNDGFIFRSGAYSDGGLGIEIMA